MLQPEEKTKKWVDYDQKMLLVYIVKNWRHSDCSFRIKTAKNKGRNKLSSFKWILSEISPALREIFLAYSEKKCKDIPIGDPNFESILKYAHTKILNNQPYEQLISLYESAYLYQIEPLMAKIVGMLQLNISETNNFTEWINLFELAYLKKRSDPRLFFLFDRIIQTISKENVEKGLEVNMKKVATFGADLFYDFLSVLKTKGIRPLICLRAIQTYLAESTNINPEISKEELETENIGRDIISLLLQNVDCTKMSRQDFQCSLKISELDDKTKKWILEEIDDH